LNEPTRIGFLVGSLGATDLAYHILREAHEYVQKSKDLDIIVFYQNVVKTWKNPSFAMMNISEAFNYSGVAVATDLVTAEKMKHFPGPSGRYFYVWDLEWLRSTKRSYESLRDIYTDPNLSLIARSDSHASQIERSWNRKVSAVVPHCELASLVKAVSSAKK
jgi:hypothetical protein